MSKIRLSTTNINFKNTIDLNRVFSPVVIPGGPTNLVINGGFESPISATNWTSNTTTPTRGSAGGAQSGSFYLNSMYDSAGSGTDNAYYTDNSALTVGSFYSISFWARSSGGASTVNVTWTFGTNTGTFAANVTLPNVWQKFTISNKQCLGNSKLYLGFDNSSLPFGLDEIWVVAGATAY